MKKMLILLAAFALTAGAASAQTEVARPARAAQPDRSPEQQADLLTRRLTKDLALSAEQADKVRQITLARVTEMHALRGKYATAGSRQGMGQDMKALRDKYDAQLKEVLNADQYGKYDQMRDEQMDKRKEKMQGGKLKVKS
ncbi:hypothetical protein [Hymenobacter persicinus]|uniref:DUF4890 domain-containing protein n=1 Tax=Hymenobacter persicinus TaxID=2025506 RepID=A0A4V1ZAR3_9BACT|nr:hypothetical protein [Hymenobacter persicinus]RYU79443.1 hypothetical protein EWM57_10880 [Hymenobacter persicinus]